MFWEIGIAREFYRNTNVIVLYEATSLLDYKEVQNLSKTYFKIQL